MYHGMACISSGGAHKGVFHSEPTALIASESCRKLVIDVKGSSQIVCEGPTGRRYICG